MTPKEIEQIFEVTFITETRYPINGEEKNVMLFFKENPKIHLGHTNYLGVYFVDGVMKFIDGVPIKDSILGECLKT